MSISLKWDDFSRFREELRNDRRYFRTDWSSDYLEAIKHTCKNRIVTIAKGTELWRARQGGSEMPISPDDATIVEYSRNEMTAPSPNLSQASRIGVKGIPVLYLSSDKDTAMSEVRPCKGQPVSLAKVCLTKDLIVIDCHQNSFDGSISDLDKLYPFGQLIRNETISDSEQEERAWAWIDFAFAQPVSQVDNPIGYIPTQVIAELFRTEGYHGIKYKSSIASGHNIAIFDVSLAKIVGTMLYHTNDIRYQFSKHQFPKK